MNQTSNLIGQSVDLRRYGSKWFIDGYQQKRSSCDEHFNSLEICVRCISDAVLLYELVRFARRCSKHFIRGPVTKASKTIHQSFTLLKLTCVSIYRGITLHAAQQMQRLIALVRRFSISVLSHTNKWVSRKLADNIFSNTCERFIEALGAHTSREKIDREWRA